MNRKIIAIFVIIFISIILSLSFFKNVSKKNLPKDDKIPEKSSLLPRLRRGEDESFLMPREDFGQAKRKRKGKKGKKGKKRSSKVVSTIKRAARNSLKKAKSILTNSKRTKRRKNRRTGRKKY